MLALSAFALPMSVGTEALHSWTLLQDEDVAQKETDQLEAMAGALVRARKATARDKPSRRSLSR